MLDNIIPIHPDFKLNGYHYNEEEIYPVAYSFIKEGTEYEELIGNFLLDWFNDNYEQMKLRTSGSTGEVKELFVSREKMKNSAEATGKRFKLPAKTKALCCIPANYVAGRMMLIRAMVLGWHLDLVEPKANALKEVEKEYDFAALTPHQLSHSLDKIHLIKKVIVGGAPISEGLLKKIQDIPTKVFETYGMTETVTHIATRRLNSSTKTKLKPLKALKNVSFTVNDQNCLIVTAPKITDEPVVTRDVVELVDDIRFYWKGRLDNVINSGGVKIHPEQVEKKLQLHIEKPFFITGISDESLGEKVVLFVESKDEADKSAIQNLVKEVETLDKFEIPKEIILVDEFEKTRTGKVNRSGTKELVKR
ncbi:AMP-binding protein [Psychroflexus planctonicus]|uniref:O-succinylbenzoic acid--CoA ligase n=1 Tax=Psychroflexus planctonicus TaxID=1526575 RepID=A0ABQ1SNI2_9FLAO|nr:AMP-binding protein [Psychroflexus planctonicus]GGE44691.1 O-succinylbenzoic acid--CoA ligase [Psychroflexus planctonicus]